MKIDSKNKSSEAEYAITDPEGKPFEIPVHGSMALLALGYRGLMAWRARRIDPDPDSYRDYREERNHQKGKIENEPAE